MLNFTHRAAHGGDKVADINQHSEADAWWTRERVSNVFSEPTYPIWEHRQPF